MSIIKYIPKTKKLPLDRYKNDLQFVFSDYLLLSGKTIKIEILEDGDGTTQEFTYINGYINKPEIQAFVGANSGYVSAMWDQKTGTKVSISTESQQRQIINSGAWVNNYTAKYCVYEPSKSSLSLKDNLLAPLNRLKNLNCCSYVCLKDNKTGVLLSSGYANDFVLPIKCSAGIDDFGWVNLSNIFWYNRDGTTSTNARPGVTFVGAGVDYSFGTNITANNVTLGSNTTNNKYIGDVLDIPKLTYRLDLGNTSVTGNILDIPLLDSLHINNCNSLTGTLASLKPYISIWVHYLNRGGIFTPSALSKDMIFHNTAMSANDTDQTLINIANITTVESGGNLYLRNNRTAASDAAVASLVGKFTITYV